MFQLGRGGGCSSWGEVGGVPAGTRWGVFQLGRGITIVCQISGHCSFIAKDNMRILTVDIYHSVCVDEDVALAFCQGPVVNNSSPAESLGRRLHLSTISWDSAAARLNKLYRLGASHWSRGIAQLQD